MLSLLITVHEFGHFIAAKKFGVHVYEFAIGMGPKVIEFKRKNDPTKYTLRALPIGGYNQLAGEVMEDDENLKPDKFMCNKPKWQRIIILIAGVCMNFILAIIFLFILSLGWGSAEQRTIVAEIIPESGAEAAGIQVGDKILKLNGRNVSNLDSLNVVSLLKTSNDTNEYLIEHKDGSRESYKIEIKTYIGNKKTGENYGVVSEENTIEKVVKEKNLNKDDVVETKIAGFKFDTKRKKGFIRSIKYAFTKFFNTVGLMFRIIFYLVTGSLGLDALSGPVGMYTVIDTATNVGSASYGLYNLIYLTAYVSINLGVMNILPFPAFDG
jgi:regulator of sigma E protease